MGPGVRAPSHLMLLPTPTPTLTPTSAGWGSPLESPGRGLSKGETGERICMSGHPAATFPRLGHCGGFQVASLCPHLCQPQPARLPASHLLNQESDLMTPVVKALEGRRSPYGSLLASMAPPLPVPAHELPLPLPAPAPAPTLPGKGVWKPQGRGLWEVLRPRRCPAHTQTPPTKHRARSVP